MPTIKIEMPTETIESLVAGKTFQVALADLPNATLVKLMTYAGQRLINDRAKGGTDVERHKAAEAIVAAMKDGSVATSQRGPSIDIATRARRNVVEGMIRVAGKTSILKGLKADARNAKLDSIAAKNAEKDSFKKMVAAEEKRLRDGGITMDVDLEL
jgi:hypothetical protein